VCLSRRNLQPCLFVEIDDLVCCSFAVKRTARRGVKCVVCAGVCVAARLAITITLGEY